MKIGDRIKLILLLCCIFIGALFLSCGLTSNAETPSKNNKIEDGIYQIQSALNNNYVLDVHGASKANGANVQIWQNNNGMNQKFEVKYLASGYYEIKALHSGKLLDVQNEGKVNGTNIQQCESTNCDAQRWIIKDAGNGYYSIISKCNGLYLDVSWALARNGSNIQVCAGTANNNAQRFKFKKLEELKGNKTIEDGIYQIQSALNNNYVLDVHGASNANGANIQIWQNNNGMNQKFQVKYLAGGYYEIKALHSGKLLDVQNAGMVNGTNIQQCEATNCDAQRWIIKDAGNGYYSIISRCNGLYLDVSWALARNGSNIQVCAGTANNNAQRFKFKKLEELKGNKTIEDGIYQIQSALNNNYVLDVYGASNANGANVQIWQNNNGMNQKFEVKYLAEGYYEIKALHSGKLLDVQNAGVVNGTNIQQCEATNCDAQRWIIKDAGNGYYNIISKCNELYLDVSWALARNGSNIQVCAGTAKNNAQRFKFVSVKALTNENAYKISMKKNSNKMLDVYQSSYDNNANVQICSEKNVKSQIFNIKYVDNTYFKITLEHSNKFLTVGDNGNVYQNDTGTDNQLWRISVANDGAFYIISKANGNYLTVEGNSISDGTNVKVSKKTNGESQMFYFKNITDGKNGTYGKSGLVYKGHNGGTTLNYYKYGCGENVLFAVFEVHGFEDNWNYDGQELTNIANNFYNKLISEKDEYIAKNWTVYIFPNVNPDGLYYGWTNQGPGRTTLYSKAPGNQGIDLNRSWQIDGTSYKRYTDSRNYNGTAGFQAYEAETLKAFLLKNKSQTGKTMLIDLHGWENSLIGDAEICSKYFAPNFPSATQKYNQFGTQYLIGWARATLNAQAALIELPNWIYSHQDVVNNKLSEKYIDSIMKMLKDTSINYPVAFAAMAIEDDVTDEEQFNIAFAGMMKKSLPTENDINNYVNELPSDNGVWIEEKSRNRLLNLINGLTNSKYEIDNNGYLKVLENNEENNKYDEFIQKLINSNKQYIFSSTGILYFRDIVNFEISCNEYEDLEKYQTYDYVESGNKMLIDITTNKENLLSDNEIMDSLIKLID